jgi:pimeloyl-ACP methyl ester carboxylesterase
VTRPPARGIVLSAVLAVLLSGCGMFGGAHPSGTTTPPPTPTLSPSAITSTGPAATVTARPGLAKFYTQKLTWSKCRGRDQCSTLRVPLDYADPGGRALSLALLKVPASAPGRRIGSLVVNPGGPGASGIEYAARASSSFGSELLAAFDIVGFDPRGVGHSTPLKCAGTSELDNLIASDPDPDTPAETRHSDHLLQVLGADCVKESGDLVRHMSTVEVAKDLDVLRAALGDKRLSYFGASYGTAIGATYAGLFAKRVGRMVLDGALDPSVSTTQLGLVQAKGFEVALRAYVGACVNRGGCFLGSSVDAGTRRIRTFLDGVEKRPLPGLGARRLEVGNAVLGIWLPLYSKSYWPILDGALKSAIAGNGAQLLNLSDAYVSRGPDGYTDNSLEALYAVNCLDHDDGVPSAQVGRYTARFERASPTFGAIFAYGLSACENWPVHSGRKGAPVHAAGAPPILVVGTTRDPATPLVWARSLAKQLDSGVLVKRDGDGHTGYHAGNSCVDSTVESYLVSGKVPTGEVDC